MLHKNSTRKIRIIFGNYFNSEKKIQYISAYYFDMSERRNTSPNNRLRNFVLLFLAVVLILQIRIFYKSREEYHSKYNFVVSDIQVSRQNLVTFFDKKNKEVYFWNYSNAKSDNFEIEDSVAKASCSKYLFIYRKDDAGKYQVYDKKSPKFDYPVSWLGSDCK